MSELVVMQREEIRALVRQAVAEALAVPSPPPPTGANNAPEACGGIVPNRVYTAEEAAEALGFKRTQTVHEIAEAELPRRRIGPKGGATRFLGRDLLRYVLGLPPVHDEPAAPPTGSLRSTTVHPKHEGDRESSPSGATLSRVPSSRGAGSPTRRRIL